MYNQEKGLFMKKNLIIFDLDGTLLNTLDDLTDSTNYALEKFGYTKHKLEDIQSFVGNGVAKLIERALPDGVNNADYKNVLETFKQHYSKNMYNKTAPYPQIIEMLKTLKKNNCKLGVVSNKFDKAVKNLCKTFFNDLIDIAAGENEAIGIKKKPAPDIVFSVMKEFSADNSNTIYVGDSEVDILTAKNANIPCISVSWGFKSKEFLIEHNAKIIIDTPCEIFKYIN